jgi:hypothetical protein
MLCTSSTSSMMYSVLGLLFERNSNNKQQLLYSSTSSTRVLYDVSGMVVRVE